MRAVDVDPFWRVRERAIQSKPTEQNSEWAMNDDDDEHGPEKLSCAVGGGGPETAGSLPLTEPLNLKLLLR